MLEKQQISYTKNDSPYLRVTTKIFLWHFKQDLMFLFSDHHKYFIHQTRKVSDNIPKSVQYSPW